MKRKFNSIFVITVLLFSLIGCGGGTAGTSGTGIKSLRVISGSVAETDGSPVTGATVNVSGENGTTTTDQNGHFEFQKKTDSNFTLEINHQGNVYELSVTDIETQSEVINVSAVLDPSNKTISSKSVDGQIALLDCEEFSQLRGNELRLSLPAEQSSCNLIYEFRVRGAVPKDVNLSVNSSNCGAISFVQTGTQVTGNRVSASQALYVSSRQFLSQRGTCSAKVNATFPGFEGSLEFKLRIARKR